MARGADQARAAALSKKYRTGTKTHKAKDDPETSSDSNEERAAEEEAKRNRERERKRRLTSADAAGEAVDRMIAEAEAKNQAKAAQLAAIRNSYPVIWNQSVVFQKIQM